MTACIRATRVGPCVVTYETSFSDSFRKYVCDSFFFFRESPGCVCDSYMNTSPVEVRFVRLKSHKIGLAGVGFHFLVGLAILFFPGIRTPVACFFGILLTGFALLLIPPRKDARSLKGAVGYLAVDGSGFLPVDERDITFARNRCLIPGS
jgi:hypothetical protein